MRYRVLVVGLPGSGKSHMTKYFAKKGKHAYDTDKVERLSNWIDKEGHVAKYLHSKYHDEEYLSKYKWRWNRAKFKKLLKENDEAYFFGSSDNETDFYKYFDRIYYLRAGKRLLSARLKSRKNRDHFGRTAQQRRFVYSWLEYVDKRARENGLVIIDAALPPKAIFNIITKRLPRGK